MRLGVPCQHQRNNINEGEKMLTVEQIREKLHLMNIRGVASEAGVSAASVYRLMNEDGKPQYQTVKALSDFFEDKK